MQGIVRAALIEIVAEYGRAIIENPARLEGLLRDHCGAHKREINALIDALRERVPLDLRAAQPGTPPAVLLATLARRLVDNRSMVAETARWTVESWAVALGVFTPEPVAPPAPRLEENPGARPGVPMAGGVANRPRRGFEPGMVRIPAGEFWMGTPDGQRALVASQDEHPYHKVQLETYWIAQYPLTCREYQAFLQDSRRTPPLGWQGDEYPPGKGDHPVVCLAWDDAVAYCAWLSQKTGQLYRLPTEAEWEKAARGGLEGKLYPWGDEAPVYTPGASSGAQFWDNPCHDTVAVGTFSPNGYGLYDLAGNVWEWVSDWYARNYYHSSPVHNPTGPASGQYRVVRGGGWYVDAHGLRVANRHYFAADIHYYSVGFRCVAVFKEGGRSP